MNLLPALISVALTWSHAVAAPRGSSRGSCSDWFMVGKTYKYSYTGSFENYLDSAVQSGTRLSCELSITTTSDCLLAMEILDCSARPVNPGDKDVNADDLIRALTRFPVVFELSEEGVSSITASQQESTQALNVKRGILSMLPGINNNEKTTVHGTCPVTQGNALNREVDLSRCTGGVVTKSIPLLNNVNILPYNGGLICSTDTSRRSQLQQITCEEMYTTQATIGEFQLKTDIRQELVLKSASRLSGSVPSINETSHRVSIVYANVEDEEEGRGSDIEPSVVKFEKMLQHFLADEMKDAAAVMSEAAGEMRKLNNAALLQIWGGVKSCAVTGCVDDNKNQVIQLYIDSLISCSTGPCLAMLVRLLKDSTMSEVKKFETMTTLAISTVPNKATVSAIIDMCDDESSTDACLIPMSIMANSLVRQTRGGSVNDVIARVLALLKDIVGSDCNPSSDYITSTAMRDQRDDKILAALKSLENLEYVINHRIPRSNRPSYSAIRVTLRNCVSNPVLSHRVAIGAFSALMKINPGVDVKEDIIANQELSLELRAYAIRKYLLEATANDITQLIQMSQTIENKQLKSYILSATSSVLSTKTSSEWSAVRVVHAQVLSAFDHVLPPESSEPLSHDIRFHQANEDVSAELDYSMLYRAGSLVPSTSFLNLTAYVLGQELELLELDLNGQGWDFTSDWSLTPDDNVLHIHDKLARKLHEIQLQIQRSQILPSVFIDVKFLGTQLGGYSLRDISFWRELAQISSTDDLERLLNLRAVANAMRGGFHDTFSKTADVNLAHITVPTGLGIPLNLTLHAAFSGKVALQVDANNLGYRYDFGQMIKRLNIDGNVNINGFASVQTTMSAGIIGVICRGVSVQDSMTSSLELPFTARGERLSIVLSINNLPSIVSAVQKRTTAEVFNNNHKREVDLLGLRPNCFLSFMEKLTGMQLCKDRASQHHGQSTIDGLLHQFSYYLLGRIPEGTQETILSFARRSLSLAQDSIKFKIAVPDLSNETARDGTWTDYFSSVWNQVRAAFVNVPRVYSAIMFEDGNVITFDGKSYQVPENLDSECTHVLARDFKEHKFTIIKSKKGTTVMASNTAITINSNYLVEVNNTGKISDLPVQTWDGGLVAKREGSAVVVETDGLQVSCDHHNRFCTFTLSGWFHNHTLGLLGTNDNEIYNDYKMRTGIIATDSDEFLESYEISGSRQCRHQRRRNRDSCPSSHHKCSDLFVSENSALQGCFRIVDPSPYYAACKDEMDSCRDDKTAAVCSVASAYRKVCSENGASLAPLDMCGSCDDKQISQTWSQDNKKILDIVFVKAHDSGFSKAEMADLLKMYLNGLRHFLKKQLGLVDIRYGLVGYGGDDRLEEAHSIAKNGDVFVDRSHFSSFIKTVVQAQSDTSRGGDEVSALRLAADYPYRSQASKLIVLLNKATLQNAGDLNIGAYLRDRSIYIQTISKSASTSDLRRFLSSNSELGDFAQLQSVTKHNLKSPISNVVKVIKSNLQQCKVCTCEHSIWGSGISKCRPTNC